MDSLTTKPQTDVDEVPTWRDLGERLRDVMRDIVAQLGSVWKKEGKELEQEVQARLLPALKRARIEVDKLVTRLEDRMERKP
jgi:hypothetical protein